MNNIWDNINWYNKHLCEYYNIMPQEALTLGTRASGRKPSLPGSKSCKPVSGMTYEDIWDLSTRKSEEEIFKFYKDQGSWSTFRQCVRHGDQINEHLQFLGVFDNVFNSGMHIVEYGCGVAPFLFTLVNSITNPTETDIRISLSDVDCEHLDFGHWRMGNILNERRYKNFNLYKETIKPNELPKYKEKIDFAIVTEVFEHVPDPIGVADNLLSQMSEGGMILENFIKHEPDDGGGPDLESAARQRSQYYEYLYSNFELIGGHTEQELPNGNRIWKRRI